MQAVILAGGLGTRLRNVVSDRPKSMADVNDRPFLELLIERLNRRGINKIVLALGYMGSLIEDYFSSNTNIEADIRYSYEEKQLGTAGAIKNAEDFLDEEDFFVLNGDTYLDISYQKLMDFHMCKGAILTMALMQSDDTSRYGKVVADEQGRIKAFVEKGSSSGTGYINAGVYVFNKSILHLMNKGEGYSLEKELLPMLLQEKLKVYGYSNRGYFIDIGIPEDYARFINDLNNGVIR